MISNVIQVKDEESRAKTITLVGLFMENTFLGQPMYWFLLFPAGREKECRKEERGGGGE